MTGSAGVARRPEVGSLGSITAVSNDGLWDYYNRLREIGDMVWDPTANAWLVSSYELVKLICRTDNADFMSTRVYDPLAETYGLSEEEWADVFHDGSSKKLANTVGEEHDRMHRWWFRAFSPKLLARWSGLIGPIADRRLSRLIEEGRAEMTADYCYPVIWEAAAAIVGLPTVNEEWFAQLCSLNASRPDPNVLIGRSTAAMRELRSTLRALPDLVRPVVLQRRTAPGDDFITMLWRDAEQIFGRDHKLEDIVASTVNALTGSTDSVGFVAGNVFYELVREPDLHARVLADGEDGVRRLIEEVIRLYGLAAITKRRATHDSLFGGVSIRKGEVVAALVIAADRDPRHYPDPGRVDLRRPSPTDHLGFWMGQRTCAGQSLARSLAPEIVGAAIRRIPGLRRDPASESPRVVNGRNVAPRSTVEK